jgi:hypothetical protein
MLYLISDTTGRSPDSTGQILLFFYEIYRVGDSAGCTEGNISVRIQNFDVVFLLRFRKFGVCKLEITDFGHGIKPNLVMCFMDKAIAYSATAVLPADVCAATSTLSWFSRCSTACFWNVSNSNGHWNRRNQPSNKWGVKTWVRERVLVSVLDVRDRRSRVGSTRVLSRMGIRKRPQIPVSHIWSCILQCGPKKCPH